MLGTEVSCPECGSRLLLAADQQSARLIAVHPLATLTAPLETEVEPEPGTPRFRRSHLLLSVGVTLSVCVGLFLSLSRNASNPEPQSPVTEVAPANAEPTVHAVKVEAREPAPAPEPVPSAPIIDPPLPAVVIEKPVEVSVVAPVPTVPEVKPADPPPVAEPKPVDDLAARTERLMQITGQRIALFETSAKTPLRQLLREVNELAAGLIVVDETVAASDLNQQVSIKRRDVNVVELLEALLQSTGLRVTVREDHISITKPAP